MFNNSIQSINSIDKKSKLRKKKRKLRARALALFIYSGEYSVVFGEY